MIRFQFLLCCLASLPVLAAQQKQSVADARSQRLGWAVSRDCKLLAGIEPSNQACVAERILQEDAVAAREDKMSSIEHGRILGLAAENTNPALMQLLLRYGFDPNTIIIPSFMLSPLHAAAREGNHAVVKVLLDAHVDVDCRDLRTWTTALWWACQSFEKAFSAAEKKALTETVRLLIEAGANEKLVQLDLGSPAYDHLRAVQRPLTQEALAAIVAAQKRGFLSRIKQIISTRCGQVRRVVGMAMGAAAGAAHSKL